MSKPEIPRVIRSFFMSSPPQHTFFVFGFNKPELISISFWFFCSTGIISTSRLHLYLAFLIHGDYFGRLDSSPSCSFSPQGLLFPGQMHLYLAFLFLRDYFHRPDASLACSFAPQRLFPPARCISILLFCSTGIISPRSDMSPIAENISARPFRQLPIFLFVCHIIEAFFSLHLSQNLLPLAL